MDDRTRQFLTDLLNRLGPAIARALRAEVPNLNGSPLIAVAITTADMNTVPAIALCTEERFQEIRASYDLLAEENEFWKEHPAENAELRFWPDEWDWYARDRSGTPDGFSALTREFDQHYRDRHEEFEAAGSEQREAFMDFWEDEGHKALTASLGHPDVRALFDELGANPILVVTETDGGAERALRSFEELNAGRDDEEYESAHDYWQGMSGCI